MYSDQTILVDGKQQIAYISKASAYFPITFTATGLSQIIELLEITADHVIVFNLAAGHIFYYLSGTFASSPIEISNLTGLEAAVNNYIQALQLANHPVEPYV